MFKTCGSIKRGGALAGLLAAGLVTSACATDGADDSAQSESANAPLAQVTLANGTVVSFFEPKPGSIAIGQEVALGVAPIATATMSASELYQSLAPGKPVPQALAAAQARATEARSGRPAAEATQKAGSALTPHFTSSWFEDNHCYENDGVGWHFINCHADPLPTQGITGIHTDIDEFRVDACANSASITLKVWVEGDQTLGVQLAPNHCYAYHWSSGVFNADSFQSQVVVNTAGNYGLAVKWNQ